MLNIAYSIHHFITPGAKFPGFWIFPFGLGCLYIKVSVRILFSKKDNPLLDETER
jgi:hypothetical protein